MTVERSIIWIVLGMGCVDSKDDLSDSTQEVSDTSHDTSTDSGLMASDEDCTNGVDDDNDGEIDCADSDCASEPSCPFAPQTNDYTNYERVAGFGYTAVPTAIPLPSSECTDANTVYFEGVYEECVVPEDTCAIIEGGVSVLCQDDMVVRGTLWMQSSSSTTQTLLIANNVLVHGSLIVSGEQDLHAQNAEIFLTHEYCGLPETNFALTSDINPNCSDNGRLQSMGGVVKITGAEKTAWSLLTQDSQDSHQALPNSIQVDHCQGWGVGDAVVVSATGGSEIDWTGLINDGFISNTDAELKWKAERRVISSLDTSTCEIVLDTPLQANHRGNPTSDPHLRIQAEVINQTRSVMITGGYLTDPYDPASRVATAYDYANDSGTPTITYTNDESVPCKVCQDVVDGVPQARPDECDASDACQLYESEDVTEYNCGEGCGLLGAQGITTAQMHGGVMQISHASIEHCGRRELAEYCLHMHHLGDVQYRVWAGQNDYESYFVGNSIQHGVNKGITLHGTHRALVQHNVVYNNRGPSIYIEDGNEIENVVEENVIICSELNASGSLGAIRRNSLCRFKNSYNRPETSDSDYDEASGIYLLSSYNHVVGNRVSGYDNAMYVNAQGGAAIHGLGQAEQRACVSAYPFGYTVGNVFHNNAGFGWYANTTFPQDMVRLGALHMDYSDGDSNIGTVTDWSACQPFSRTGEDQSFNVQLYDHVEYFNDFSAGGYDLGDISLHNYTNYGSNKSLYWKTYRRGSNSGPLCDDCTFVNTNFDLMGGSALVEFKDSDFYLNGHQINLNHHCRVGDAATGSLCASHYDFRTSNFHEYDGASSAYTSGTIDFRSEVDDTAALVFAPEDLVFVQSNKVVFDIEQDARCESASTDYTYQAGWWQCQDQGATGGDLGLRIVRIYSPDRGPLTVTNHSEGDSTYTFDWESNGTQESPASRVYPYSPYCTPGFFSECPNYMAAMGYVFVVPAQEEISLTFSESISSDVALADLFTVEYSEEQMTPQTSITIREVSGTGLMDGATNCVVDSTHKRDFITPFGPIYAGAGAWYDCQAWELNFTVDDYFDSIDDFGDLVDEPSTEPSGEPSEEPQVDEFRLYLTEAALVDARPVSSSGEIPANSGNNVNTVPVDASLVHTLEISGVNGVYQGGDVEFNLSMDTQSVGQTVQARMQIDVDGDGAVDVERLYEFWALDAALGNWETFTTPNIASSTGAWSDMNNGTVRIDLWSSFGGDTIRYAIPESYLVLPIE